MHLVWAGIGATVATLICVVGSASVLHAANQERPDSLAGVISLLANPGSNANPLRLNYDMMAPRAVTDPAIEMSEEDAEYALSAVVSREGRVQGIEVINDAQPLGKRAVVNAMLNEAYRVQFAPAQARTGDAVAVSMVWLVANTTVKGRHDDGLGMLRQALRLAQRARSRLARCPCPSDATASPSRRRAAPMVKPVVPEAFEARRRCRARRRRPLSRAAGRPLRSSLERQLPNLDLAGPDIPQRIGRANHQRAPGGVGLEPNLERLLPRVENAVARERRLPALRIERVLDAGDRQSRCRGSRPAR